MRNYICLLAACILQVHFISAQQECYTVERLDLGMDRMLYNEELKNTACEVILAMEAVDAEGFKIIGDSYYRFLKENDGFLTIDDVHTWSTQRAKQSYQNGFLLVGKVLNEESTSIVHKVKLVLPSTGKFATLSKLQISAIEHDVESVFNTFNNGAKVAVADNPEVEIQALKLLINYINKIAGETLEIENLFELNEFDVIPIGSSAEIVGGPENARGELESGLNKGFDYAGLSYKPYATGDLVNLTELLVNGPGGGQVDLLADEFEISTAYVVSSQSIPELDGVRQSVDDYLTNSDLVYWFHYDGDKRALYLKVFANMDAEKAQKIFNFYFSRDMYTFRAGTFTNPDPNAGYALTLEGDCTSFGPTYGKTCLIDGYKSVYPFSEAPFTLGLAGGMLDGLLGMLYFAYETSESLLTTTWSIFSSSWSYINKLRTVYARTESWLKVAETATTDARETVKSTLVAMSEVYQLMRSLAGKVVSADWKPILSQIAAGVKTWLGNIVSDASIAGYFVGQLAFELISDAATGGGQAAGKFFATASKWLTKLKDGKLGIADDIAKMLADAAKLNPKNAAKAAKCKLLGSGCFLAGTGVMAAGGIVPIESVQLFDQVVASTEVIAHDAEIGYVDSWSSPQQLERDRSIAGDDDLYAVTFLANYTGSTAQLVLSEQWMRQNHIDSVNQLYHLQIPEQGISGPVTIVDIRRFKPVKNLTDEEEKLPTGYALRQVTGLFTHTSDQVVAIALDNGDTLKATAWHPIYSISENDWRLAAELNAGDAVKTFTGGSAKVICIDPLPGTHKVYNLEVRELHNYLVGRRGAVVHNACSKSQVLAYFDDSKPFADLASSRVAEAVEELRKLRSADRRNFDQFFLDFDDKLDLSQLGGASGVKAWMSAMQKGIRESWRKDPKIIRYLGDLADGAKLGEAVAAPTISITNYRGRFYARFKGASADMEIHHALPQAVFDSKYPGLITELQLHSLENLRGIPKGTRYNGTGLHNYITQLWNAFYQANPNADLEALLDFVKSIDNDFGHLFVPPIR